MAGKELKNGTHGKKPDALLKTLKAGNGLVSALAGLLVAILAGTPVGSTIVAADMIAFALFSLAGALTGGMH